MSEKEILSNVESFFAVKVSKAFNYDVKASKALGLISQQLTDDLFNFIEPAFIDFKFILVKHFEDRHILPETDGVSIKMNKAALLSKNADIVIQVFEDKNVILWENIDYSNIFDNTDALFYVFEKNKEMFIANKEVIDVTSNAFGSRFSGEFAELELQLDKYKLHKVKHSSCPILNKSWHSENRIFFIGGDKDVPEKFMQESLQNFITDLSIFKGEIGQFEPTREHNIGGQKPVDIIVRWEKSNRIALIEIKWLGKSIHEGKFKSEHSNGRANKGYEQLKGYYDLIKKDYPSKIIKCYLVVIDGRRKGTKVTSTSIDVSNGMHFENVELNIDADKMYYTSFKSMARPIRMFAEPNCSK